MSDQDDQPIANSGKWSVAALVREPLDVLRRFVAWHLEAGASRIILFFDDPHDPGFAALREMPGVWAIRCTALFWIGVGLEQNAPFVERQRRCLQFAYARCLTPWLLVIDADELLYLPGVRLDAFLADRAPDVRSVVFRTAEHVTVEGHGPGTFLRLPMLPRQIARTYPGALADALAPRQGLVGHHYGKSILRTGIADMRVRQHFGQLPDYERIEDQIVAWPEGAVIHILAEDAEDWRRKLDFRMAGWSFTRGLREWLGAAVEAADEDRIAAQYTELFRFSGQRAASMLARGMLAKLDLDLDLDAAVSRHFPEPVAAAAPNQRDIDKSRA